LKRAVPITLLLATPAAAQDASPVQGFAEGFTFHSHFGASRKVLTSTLNLEETGIDEQMMPAFKATAERLTAMCYGT
jgi:hypothetical protein